MNKFQNIIHRRITSLVLDAQSAGEPRHNPTAGYLREKYIIRFLKDMTPWGISLNSGVLFDAKDRISPQIDLIAVNNFTLPAIALHEGLSMVPVEAALLTAEIKSSLNSEGLEQLAKQNRGIRELGVFAPAGSIIVPTIMLALDSSLSVDTVIDWMQERQDGELVNGNTSMCCVVGKYYLIRQGDEIKLWAADGNYLETLSFIADFWGALVHLQQRRQESLKQLIDGHPHPLEIYLKGLVK